MLTFDIVARSQPSIDDRKSPSSNFISIIEDSSLRGESVARIGNNLGRRVQKRSLFR
jgi:hypothetical protein